MDSLILLLHTLWRKHFSSEVVKRSEEYLWPGAIKDLKCTEVTSNSVCLSGLIKGTARKPYKTIVTFTSTGTSGGIETNCSCPYAHGDELSCKHSAALIQQAIRVYSKTMYDDGTTLSRNISSDTSKRPGENLTKPLARWIRDLSLISPRDKESSCVDKTLLLWELTPGSKQTGGPCRLQVRSIKCTVQSDGSLYNSTHAFHHPSFPIPENFEPSDEERLFCELFSHLKSGLYYSAYNPVNVPRNICDRFLEIVIPTGRAIFPSRSYRERPKIICRMDDAPGLLGWSTIRKNTKKIEPIITVGGDEARHVILGTNHAWHLNPTDGTLRKLVGEYDVHFIEKWITGPSIAKNSIAAAKEEFSSLGIDYVPPPVIREASSVVVTPVPHVRLLTIEAKGTDCEFLRHEAEETIKVSLARLTLKYGDIEISPLQHGGTRAVTVIHDGKEYEVFRDAQAEQSFVQELLNSQLVPFIDVCSPRQTDPKLWQKYDFCAGYLSLEYQIGTWKRFFNGRCQNLEKKGWRFEVDPDFYHLPVTVTAPVEFNLSEGRENETIGDWFDLKMGITIEEKKIDLVPILLTLMRNEALVRYGPAIPINIEGKLYEISSERISSILNSIMELHNPETRRSDKISISKMTALALGDLETKDLMWQEPSFLKEMRGKFNAFKTITPRPIKLPKSFQGKLRPYQEIGLSWLQFLSEYEFHGILADDMGLGKTVQTLAHLAIQKEKKSLKYPVLIVCPTSVVANWKKEIERFLPSLTTLIYHGKERRLLLPRVSLYDVVVTTYTILRLDESILTPIQWDLVIFDESQNIKNASSLTAIAAAKIQARQRLCLTGTPMENNLSELWSHFHLLMPGYLGTYPTFRQFYQSPIEQNNSQSKRIALQRRIAPFIMRRKKEEVAKDLPAKTISLQTISFDDEQRDLYESIRSVMDKRVRDEIAKKGVARAQIMILDALLKLRQCCCDPRLVPTTTAKKSTRSAKLLFLKEFLPPLIEEGRRILLFSQFTSMLDLIEESISQLEKPLPYVRLDGTSRNRGELVESFQSGKYPIFLLSLKAGGTGLNLTAADVVIHYDPWWNPAVEDQATDRAHRIGQQKPVFVYKLIIEGSIEEKMIALQERKKSLISKVLVDGDQHISKLTKDEILSLFSPLASTSSIASVG